MFHQDSTADSTRLTRQVASLLVNSSSSCNLNIVLRGLSADVGQICKQNDAPAIARAHMLDPLTPRRAIAAAAPVPLMAPQTMFWPAPATLAQRATFFS